MIYSALITTMLLACGGTFAVSTANVTKTTTVLRKTQSSLSSYQFVPLSCNDDIDKVKCDSWSDRYGTREKFNDLVIVPCGECLVFDPDMNDATVSFNDGIDIRGKLVIPDGITVQIRTPMIIVQGELQIYATKNAVNGIPSVHIVLTGQNPRSFIAIDENSKKCNTDGTTKCEVGKKSITVAGGKITFQGLPPNTPTWVKLYDVAYVDGDNNDERPSAIVVDDSIKNKWDVGAEIVITSHTQEWDGHQVRTITKISKYDEDDGYVQIELDTPIIRPTTIRQSSTYAVEVALLSRNILFEGGPDDNKLHGGHFMIMDTPSVKQTFVGVEIKNFGQQGYLGRYPIHFHRNNDMSGSIVAKNTIRQSNQRCIVLHGTTGLRVEGNVAYDTKGHCYVVEDGIETNNVFIGNLGAQTGKVSKIIPNIAQNGRETDNEPATFWITNPTNSWIGNVAAGSEGSGYWFELMLRGMEAQNYPHLNPKSDKLIMFKDNVAHSNANKGFQTYPTGYIPDGLQEMIGLKSYRNGGQGIFLHLTRNIKIENALVADNRYIGVDIDRAEGITVKNTKIVGLSRSYADFMIKQEAKNVCAMERLYGLDLHTWKHMPENDKVTIEDVSFSGYNNNNCDKSYPIHVDDDLRTGQFNAFCSLRDVEIEDHASPITLCDAEKAGIDDIYFSDLDGSLHTKDRDITAPSAVVSNSATMMTFIDDNKCTSNPSGCYNYCEKTCFRSFRFEIDPASTENYSLRVCSRSNPNKCIRTKGYQKYSDLKDFIVGDNRVFFAHVPVGSYEATFLNQNGERTWPSFVLTSQEELTCPTPFPDNAMKVVVPSADCTQLIRNGNLEASDSNANFWLFRNGGIEVERRKGIGNSNAMAPIERTGKASLIQYLDTRCLSSQKGRLYKVSAMIKLENGSGKAVFCDSSRKECPEVGYRSSNDGVYRQLATVDPASNGSKEGYQLATAIFEINDDMASSDQTLIYIQSNVAGTRMFVDDVTIKLIEEDSDICKNIIVMPEMLPTQNWRVVENGKLDVIDGPIGSGNKEPSMWFKNRDNDNDSIAYNNWPSLMLSKCFVPKSTLKITAQLQLLRRGEPVSCNVSANDCPALRFVLYNENDEEILNENRRSYTSKDWKENGFNVAVATISLPPASSKWDGSINKVIFQIGSFSSDYDLVIGSVQISPI